LKLKHWKDKQVTAGGINKDTACGGDRTGALIIMIIKISYDLSA